MSPGSSDVRFTPESGHSVPTLFDHPLGTAKQRGRVPSRGKGFLSTETSSFDAVQQLRAVEQLCAVACFNFSLFHFYHTLVNSSSRSCEQAEQIL
jgi:hypothetical protein